VLPLRIIEEIAATNKRKKTNINHVVKKQFDSWCRTIQNKAPAEMQGLCCFRGLKNRFQ
jgi:nucleoid DNA-binding protein